MESRATFLPQTRTYQQEMLEESLNHNVVVAMDTGSGKSHIAVLRMMVQLEREPNKISWFLAPTVTLCEQQRDMISASLPVPVGLISGELNPDQWTDPQVWKKAVDTHRIMVSTPQVLLDALRHGYVNMGSQIGLLVFDEAHHAADNHPYNRIMREFFDPCPSSENGSTTSSPTRPSILGLTASPAFGKNVQRSIEKIEANLQSVILTPQATRDILESHVHRPIFSSVQYPSVEESNWTASANTVALNKVYKSLDIERDPYVKLLRDKLTKKTLDEPTRKRTDQRLSLCIDKKDTFVHKGMRDFLRTAKEICIDIGPWAADWYVFKVVSKALKSDAAAVQQLFRDRHDKEKTYLIGILKNIDPTKPPDDTESIVQGCSEKTNVFIQCLRTEKENWERIGEPFCGLTFITRRDSALALSQVISRHPETAHRFPVGTLLGGSDSSKRNAFLDLSRTLITESHSEVLGAFRIGDRNLVISTAVAEEGIDIQACCTVIRWDPPQNMVSWAQSRGRARKKSSSFILMVEDGGAHAEIVKKWESLEKQMKESYNNEQRKARMMLRQTEDVDDSDDDYEEFTIASTGAKITTHMAVSHIAHFCNKLYASEREDIVPIYDLTPPDYPLGYHELPADARCSFKVEGPFGATLTLPRMLPHRLRIFNTQEIHPSKKVAQRRVAFEAYKALYDAGLLNEHALPLHSEVSQLLDAEVQRLYQDVAARDGFANVSRELDPWEALNDVTGLPSASSSWWSNVVDVDGLGRLQMFTQRQIAQIDFSNDLLYDPKCGDRSFTIIPGSSVEISDERLTAAKLFTQRLFSVMYGGRMVEGSVDFSYLFLPYETNAPDEEIWQERREWATAIRQDLDDDRQNSLQINAKAFGEAFDYPSDIIMVSSGRLYFFKNWKFERLSSKEEDMVKRRYAHARHGEVKITYPTIVAEPVRHRRNFLVFSEASKEEAETILLPQYSRIVLENERNLTFGLLLPSILRAMFVRLVSQSFKNGVLDGVLALRRIPLELVKTALVTPAANPQNNYERLESLGDAILKLVASIHLLAAHPAWPEGFLSRRKDHSVSNSHLAKAAIEKRLFKWIVRQPFSPRKWSPDYSSAATDADNDTTGELSEADPSVDVVPVPTDGSEVQLGSDPVSLLSTKVLADVVEALTGASFLTGDFDCAIECLHAFNIDIGTPWTQLSDCISSIVSQGTEDDETESIIDRMPEVDIAQKITGYSFKHRVLLVEALMHSSSISSIKSFSYERMEFLGDALLDTIVIKTLYDAEKDGKVFAPSGIHFRKAAVVNTHFLAFLCLRADTFEESELARWDHQTKQSVPTKTTHQHRLSQCLIHSSHAVLNEGRNAVTRFNKYRNEIELSLRSGSVFPWTALARLHAPKFISDMFESVLGALYLDSGGKLDMVVDLLERLGFMEVLKRIIHEDIELMHPVSRLTEWAAKRHMQDSLDLSIERVNNLVNCRLTLDGEAILKEESRAGGKACEEEVKFEVAEKGLALLKEKFDDNST